MIVNSADFSELMMGRFAAYLYPNSESAKDNILTILRFIRFSFLNAYPRLRYPWKSSGNYLKVKAGSKAVEPWIENQFFP